MDSLVSTEWLASELGADDLRILDATFFLPADNRDARAEFDEAHIPGAVFADLDGLADRQHAVPGMLPPSDIFAAGMEELGVSDGDRIVVYDNSAHHTSARLWWMLRSHDARDVAILDGGMMKWSAEGRPVEGGAPTSRRGRFTPRFDPDWLADKALVASALQTGSHELVDARSASRFAGEAPEPRPGVAPGHIPGSRNLPHDRLFNPDNSFKRGEALREAIEAAGVDLARPMVTTCGSGVTAAVILFGAHLLGKRDVRLYDGSWAEWGSDPSTPKAVGK